MTWLQVLLEWQRDWARTKTYDAVTGVAKEHGGAYGVGIGYAKAMFGAHEGEKKKRPDGVQQESEPLKILLSGLRCQAQQQREDRQKECDIAVSTGPSAWLPGSLFSGSER